MLPRAGGETNKIVVNISSTTSNQTYTGFRWCTKREDRAGLLPEEGGDNRHDHNDEYHNFDDNYLDESDGDDVTFQSNQEWELFSA